MNSGVGCVLGTRGIDIAPPLTPPVDRPAPPPDPGFCAHAESTRRKPRRSERQEPRFIGTSLGGHYTAILKLSCWKFVLVGLVAACLKFPVGGMACSLYSLDHHRCWMSGLTPVKAS